MIDDPDLVHRSGPVLRPDPTRVIAKRFSPGQEIVDRGVSRADVVISRVLAMTDDEVAVTLASVREQFRGRHRDLSATFADHFGLVGYRPGLHASDAAGSPASPDRRQLIGAYFTQEYSVEAAALFNPSAVPHPDQSGLAAGELRFVMSVRAVGEGHLSSVEFRTGVIGPAGRLALDPPGPYLSTGTVTPAPMPREYLRDALAGRADSAAADQVLSLLPTDVHAGHLQAALATVAGDKLTRGGTGAVNDAIRRIASGHYRRSFPPERELSERVLYPAGDAESHGLEDVRLTRFVETDGAVTYYGTYTAFDGERVSPHLLRTADFATFESSQLIGPAARNKGMALFPRRVGGRYLALSRADGENIGLTRSDDLLSWAELVTVARPVAPWELIQLGNCGPPIETPEGWLVLTHGVGPMRSYGIGAILLDLDDPAVLLGSLPEPLLTPTGDERDGYVPNVVYSCGGVVAEQTLVLPYGCSDSTIRFAFVDLPGLIGRLLDSRPGRLAEALSPALPRSW